MPAEGGDDVGGICVLGAGYRVGMGTLQPDPGSHGDAESQNRGSAHAGCLGNVLLGPALLVAAAGVRGDPIVAGLLALSGTVTLGAGCYAIWWWFRMSRRPR